MYNSVVGVKSLFLDSTRFTVRHLGPTLEVDRSIGYRTIDGETRAHQSYIW